MGELRAVASFASVKAPPPLPLDGNSRLAGQGRESSSFSGSWKTPSTRNWRSGSTEIRMRRSAKSTRNAARRSSSEPSNAWRTRARERSPRSEGRLGRSVQGVLAVS